MLIEMEKELFDWIIDKVNAGHKPSNMQIREKAKNLSKIKNFKYSSGWLKKFSKRFNLNKKVSEAMGKKK